ncbi:bifunctional phosphopantothenoylcysteine decarboxylase/phosphopantothenate--cysteine ligase CoaBC [Bifidobacterium aesculapii]|uniref:bifunctional phosphopantothenoylcysteine decarboxylase/phosphopantothenate--cysteine ligase CoaBC n=1 Tax=Bifidobacterium aesculapii TaxID=1329411 RepID=UPI0006E28454|nr:bifunctional phosphopantothenoylcysteine decarboxylase/phosphopantothenate--cysteine ligase CoaBC [Bifidobacterium aesculapii]
MAHVLLGVTGSIAAFKSCHLASDWTKAGHVVRVVETAAAERFVTPLTFTSLTGQPTRTVMFPDSPAVPGDVAANPQAPATINHVKDAAWADVLVVAPASADVIARIAAGMADDTLTSTILAYEGPKLLCPAMNVHMFDNPATQRNLGICRDLGWRVLDPAEGNLACGDTGRGRMPEPEEIERAVAALLGGTDGDGATASQPLKGLHVLVTAGPTQEPLDPVRYLTNHSTGKMGYAVAAAAAALGARVTLVSGPVALDAPEGVDVVRVVTARDMFAAVGEAFADADITVMAAAVGDFRVDEVSAEKIKKAGRESMTLRLVSNPDILAWAGEHKRSDGSQILCGFAMETEHLLANAAGKLASKHCDMLVANNLRDKGAGFATDTNLVAVLTPSEQDAGTPHIEHWDLMDKTALAKRLLLRLAALRG